MRRSLAGLKDYEEASMTGQRRKVEDEGLE